MSGHYYEQMEFNTIEYNKLSTLQQSQTLDLPSQVPKASIEMSFEYRHLSIPYLVH